MMDQNDGIAELVGLMNRDDCWSLHLEDPIPDLELEAVERELAVVLPRSYRAFLRRFGSARVAGLELFGVPRNRLWGDVVLMNQLAAADFPAAYVLFSRNRLGQLYCLDTSRRTADGECPVVVVGLAPVGITVAHTFLEFLRKAVGGEL
jgi:hypothetical protein